MRANLFGMYSCMDIYDITYAAFLYDAVVIPDLHI